ncbi:hypothetical protein [Photobacterium sp. Hal280]|uniref:hypothetical protein n=1 Tax=Photobacterium sp. Hal280 TaxID=3035163 RepID=UPI00301BD66E
MKQPTREKINEWINTTERLRSRKQKLFNDGYMQLNNLSIEGVFYSFSLYDKHDAICFALLDDKAQALESLNRSVTNGMIPYQMAFDDNCEFHEIARSPEDNGFIHLPIAHQQALTMAALNNDVLNQSLLPFLLLLESDLNDGDSMEMVQTVEALRNILAHGDDAKSEALLKVALDHSKTHPIQGGGDVELIPSIFHCGPFCVVTSTLLMKH